MKKMDVLKASLCWLVLLLSCVTARADEKSDYLKLAQQVREEVWNDTPADFILARQRRSCCLTFA